jgi:hypothetical protein
MRVSSLSKLLGVVGAALLLAGVTALAVRPIVDYAVPLLAIGVTVSAGSIALDISGEAG